MLDRAALLHDCVLALAREDAALSARFARMDMALFLPWGLRLAALLEEMLGQRIEAADLAHVEGEVAAPAAALLGALGRISRAYLAALADAGGRRRVWIIMKPRARRSAFRPCSCPARTGLC